MKKELIKEIAITVVMMLVIGGFIALSLGEEGVSLAAIMAALIAYGSYDQWTQEQLRKKRGLRK